MIPELTHCPFCGGKACLEHSPFILGVQISRGRCLECGAHGREVMYRPTSDGGAQAEADYAAACAWNTRAPAVPA